MPGQVTTGILKIF